jgi:hypothetical protein
MILCFLYFSSLVGRYPGLVEEALLYVVEAQETVL